MEPYRLHIFVCLGKRCGSKGSEEVLEAVKEKIKNQGLKPEVRVSRTGCLQVCHETEPEAQYSPAMVIYPDGIWYRKVQVSDIDEIIEKHVKGGQVVERLLHFRMSR